MNVLMVGDIVEPGAVAGLAERLSGLRRDRDVDPVIANAENCAVTAPVPYGGFGMTARLVEMLLGSGVDVVTSGNYGWDGPDAEAIHRHPRVLRPHNFSEEVMGKGSRHTGDRGRADVGAQPGQPHRRHARGPAALRALVGSPA